MLRLEPFTEQDIPRLISWIPSARFLLQWAGTQFTYPLDEAQLLRYLIRSSETPPTLLIFKAVDADSEAVIGHCELMQIDRQHRCARAGRILVGAPDMRGKGLGGQLVRALLDVAFGELHLHRVELEVFDFNTSAMACYQKIGFQTEGVLREARKFGDEYWNLCLMSILETEWQGKT
jgi:RimJ/RimL family protein N-acetyltransferase